MTDDRTAYSVNVGVDGQLGAELLLAPETSDSEIAVVEHTLPPGKLAAPLHRHSREDEFSYILEGTMGIQEGDEVSTASGGDVAVKARDVWHTFWNPGPEPLRFLEIIAPGEFAWYFHDVAELRETHDGSEAEARDRLDELNDEYGFEIDYESVPGLIERHGLER